MDREEAPQAASKEQTISTARKVRFAALILVLVGTVGALIGVQIHRRNSLRGTIADLRASLGELDLNGAERLLARARDMEPESNEANRYAVPVYYAASRLALAVGAFNSLDGAQILEEMDQQRLALAADAGRELGLSEEQVRDLKLGERDVLYLQNAGLMWNLASRVTTGITAQWKQALILLRWFAHHTMPSEASGLPWTARDVVWRGYGTPRQLALTYAELVRQVGVQCKVAVLPDGDEMRTVLVEVHPNDSEPFLVDPAQGVPLLHPDTRRLLSAADLARDAGPYDRLLAMAEMEPEFTAAEFGALLWQTPIHPYALLNRFALFEHLLIDLPAHPRLSAAANEEAVDLSIPVWRQPAQMILRAPTPEAEAATERAYASLLPFSDARLLAMQGRHNLAERAYSLAEEELAATQEQTEVPEAAAEIRRAMAALSFHRGMNALDGGAIDTGRTHLNRYLEMEPQGRMAGAARTVLAEALDYREGGEAARKAWMSLSGPRRLFGRLRMAGLLPVVGGARTPSEPLAGPPVQGPASAPKRP